MIKFIILFFQRFFKRKSNEDFWDKEDFSSAIINTLNDIPKQDDFVTVTQRLRPNYALTTPDSENIFDFEKTISWVSETSLFEHNRLMNNFVSDVNYYETSLKLSYDLSQACIEFRLKTKERNGATFYRIEWRCINENQYFCIGDSMLGEDAIKIEKGIA